MVPFFGACIVFNMCSLHFVVLFVDVVSILCYPLYYVFTSHPSVYWYCLSILCACCAGHVDQMPMCLSAIHARRLSATGVLLGIAVRTGSPLSLSIAEWMWKQLAGLQLSIADLMEMDKDLVPGQCPISQGCLVVHSSLCCQCALG